MTSPPDGDQLAFDIDELIRQTRVESAPPWTGAPLGFTTDYYTPADLVEAFAHWQLLHGSAGSHARSHMWHRSICAPAGLDLGEHPLEMFAAELRCDPPLHEGGDTWPRGA